MSFCEDCPKYDFCDFPCDSYLKFLSAISDCVDKNIANPKTCKKCKNRGQVDCPITEMENNKLYQDWMHPQLVGETTTEDWEDFWKSV